MQYTPLERDEIFRMLEPLVTGCSGGALALLDVKSARHKGSSLATLTVYHPDGSGVSLDDCRLVSRAVEARLELEFAGSDLTVQVASPGIDRKIVNGAEFPLWLGRGVKVYRTDTSAWSAGILKEAEKDYIILEGKEEMVKVNMKDIAKAKLAGERAGDAK
jgi:ribosome maturation factor RimP